MTYLYKKLAIIKEEIKRENKNSNFMRCHNSGFFIQISKGDKP